MSAARWFPRSRFLLVLKGGVQEMRSMRMFNTAVGVRMQVGTVLEARLRVSLPLPPELVACRCGVLRNQKPRPTCIPSVQGPKQMLGSVSGWETVKVFNAVSRSQRSEIDQLARGVL